MNEEIDEFDIYHQDFTTASEWEVFIARIEEVLIDWKLNKSQTNKKVNKHTTKWLSKSEELKFYSCNFSISYNYLEADERDDTDVESEVVISPSNLLQSQMIEGSFKFMNEDNSEDPYPVSTWFGLKEYVMLTPKSALTEENQIKLILSSINVAYANVSCIVPMFVKIREHWQPNFQGIFEDNDFITTFDTIHLKRIPSQFYHMNGLINLFKGKLASPQPLDPIQMSAKFSYDLQMIDKFKFFKATVEDFHNDNIDVKKWAEIPFGAKTNPLSKLYLNVIWPKFYEDAVIDSATYTDFDPLMAPTWSISLEFNDNLKCYTSEHINKILELLDKTELLMDTLGLSKSLGLVNPLHKITDTPISKLVKVALGSQTKQEFKGPIYDTQMMALLYYIFPDAVEDTSSPYPENLDVEFKMDPKCRKQSLLEKVSDSLVTRLSFVAARLLDIGGLPYLAHFWYEFTQELQYRWEHRILIPGIAAGLPNPRSCLLHQKLQLLNCCTVKARGQDENSSEEEFFDCSEDEDVKESEKPTGRLKQMEGAKLKNGQPLYIPRTQDPPPKTEDQLDEDTEILLRLGNDSRGAEMRAKMMSASLLSDMEAFKAANPGAELCDFLQWYSPRDWLPDDGGALGERMLLPDNPWVEAWSVARAVPITRQRRLFDERREAEQCIHYLRSRSVADVAQLVLPTLLRSVSGAVLDKRRALEARAREIYEAEQEYARESHLQKILTTARPGRNLDAEEREHLKAGVSLPSCRREFTLRAQCGGWQLMRAALAEDMLIVAATTKHSVLL